MIGLVTEGRSDKTATPEICKKLGISVCIRKMDKNNLAKAKRYATLLISSGCKKVIVLKDLHGSTVSKIETDFKNTGFPSKVELCIAVRAIESWFLADERALGDYLGSNVKRFPNPENVSKPDEVLDGVFRKEKGRAYYKGGQDPAEVAKRLRLDIVEKKCPSFKNFRAALIR